MTQVKVCREMYIYSERSKTQGLHAWERGVDQEAHKEKAPSILLPHVLGQCLLSVCLVHLKISCCMTDWTLAFTFIFYSESKGRKRMAREWKKERKKFFGNECITISTGLVSTGLSLLFVWKFRGNKERKGKEGAPLIFQTRSRRSRRRVQQHKEEGQK